MLLACCRVRVLLRCSHVCVAVSTECVFVAWPVTSFHHALHIEAQSRMSTENGSGLVMFDVDDAFEHDAFPESVANEQPPTDGCPPPPAEPAPAARRGPKGRGRGRPIGSCGKRGEGEGGCDAILATVQDKPRPQCSNMHSPSFPICVLLIDKLIMSFCLLCTVPVPVGHCSMFSMLCKEHLSSCLCMKVGLRSVTSLDVWMRSLCSLSACCMHHASNFFHFSDLPSSPNGLISGR